MRNMKARYVHMRMDVDGRERHAGPTLVTDETPLKAGRKPRTPDSGYTTPAVGSDAKLIFQG